MDSGETAVHTVVDGREAERDLVKGGGREGGMMDRKRAVRRRVRGAFGNGPEKEEKSEK